MSDAMVQVRNVHKSYVRGKQTVEVLHGLTLDIPKGDFVALMGPSGSGKTTLLNLIGGLDGPTSGEIHVGGERIDKLSGGELAKWRARNVGFVFQFYNLMPVLTAERNVELPLLLTKLSAAQRRKIVAVALEVVGLTDRARHKPKELSGGQEQRVAIARALGLGPGPAHLRRADRRPRPQDGRRDPGTSAGAEPRPRQDDRHGHARPEGGRVRKPDTASRERPAARAGGGGLRRP